MLAGLCIASGRSAGAPALDSMPMALVLAELCHAAGSLQRLLEALDLVITAVHAPDVGGTVPCGCTVCRS